MKRIAILSLLLLAARGIASPEADMNTILDALYRADGDTVYRGLTLENQEALSTVMVMLRMAPAEVANRLRQDLDVQISSSEVCSLSEQDLISVIIDSPFFRSELPYSRDMISCEDHEMQGDTAVVFISILNEDSVYRHSMVLQQGTWRVAESFF